MFLKIIFRRFVPFRSTFIYTFFLKWFYFDRHAQAISSIQAFAHWLSQFYSETHKVNLDKDKFASLISTLLDSIVPMFSKEVNSYYQYIFVYNTLKSIWLIVHLENLPGAVTLTDKDLSSIVELILLICNSFYLTQKSKHWKCIKVF